VVAVSVTTRVVECSKGEGSGGGMQGPLPQSQHAASGRTTYRSSSAVGGAEPDSISVMDPSLK
jgi:hypothetical protein